MVENSCKEILQSLVSGKHITAEQSWWFINYVMQGESDPAVVGAVLATQQMLGFTPQEVEGAAKAMVENARSLDVSRECVDIVGTGGDGASTVNLSTMGAVVAAAAGLCVVKHGNRAASSKCGAGDVLEALGLPLDLSVENVKKNAEELGITFAFAKTFHPAMRFVAPIRSALGIPCIFNILGPLTNPAKPKYVAIGCAKREISPIMAQVYANRGQQGMVYTSYEGLDELVPTGNPVTVWEIRDGKVTQTEFNACEALSIDPVSVDDLRGGEPALNADIFRRFLQGEKVASRSTALLNAASAIVAQGSLIDENADLNSRFAQAYEIATQAVDSGKALRLLDDWILTAKQQCE